MTSEVKLILGIGIFYLILLLLDFYVYRGIRIAIPSTSRFINQTVSSVYWSVNILFLAGVTWLIVTFSWSKGPTSILFKILAIAFVLLYLPKLIFSLFLLFEDIYRLLRAIGVGFYKIFSPDGSATVEFFQSRRKLISRLAALVAGIPFAGVLYGVTKGKYNFKVHRIELSFKDLPKEFNNLKIAQISDIHAGSLDDFEKVKSAVELVNAQHSDIIFFTGDMVNLRSDEMLPWVPIFKQLHAPMGIYSILGNHDYGDYTRWDSPEEKEANLNQLLEIHKKLGFKLLRNEHLQITKGNSFIDLLGIENWGRGGFSKYGNFSQTLFNTHKNSFKILLSHDPTQWEEQVMNAPEMVNLTLSGHTHGFQMGFEFPGIRFSPAQFRYKRWAGLYVENDRYLYVNRGLGFIGLPGRVGIWPEITVITLKCA